MPSADREGQPETADRDTGEGKFAHPLRDREDGKGNPDDRKRSERKPDRPEMEPVPPAEETRYPVEEKPKEKHEPAKPPIYKRPIPVIIAAVVLLVAICVGAYFIWHAMHYQSTDDAYIDGDVNQISPRVSGYVAKLLVTDNQKVAKDQTLLELDPRDYQAAADQARATVAVAQAAVDAAKKQIDADRASVDAAEASVNQTESDLKRYQSLPVSVVSAQQLDQARAAYQTASANLNAANVKVAADEANVAEAVAKVRQAEASLRAAELNLSYTKVVAPCDGRVTRRTVAGGEWVQPGQALLAVVPEETWVTANFKETQLKKMRPGQPVTVKIDAYPGLKLKGHVDSVQAGSGARFSLLPAENATGNFVKVVQRVPVKIVFDEDVDRIWNSGRVLAPGLSVEPTVRVEQ